MSSVLQRLLPFCLCDSAQLSVRRSNLLGAGRKKEKAPKTKASFAKTVSGRHLRFIGYQAPFLVPSHFTLLIEVNSCLFDAGTIIFPILKVGPEGRKENWCVQNVAIKHLNLSWGPFVGHVQLPC